MTSTRSAGEWNRRNNYLNHLKLLLNKFYSVSDKRSMAYVELNSEIKGFLDAGLLSRVATEKDLQKFIDLQHYGVKGKSETQPNDVPDASGTQDWEEYEAPSYQRKGPRAAGSSTFKSTKKTSSRNKRPK